jgi:valyl-tRNA synthetase
VSDTPNLSNLSKAYDPGEVEARLSEWWEKRTFFHAEPDAPGEPYAIVIPPPNVTGSLHIGHALTFTVEDAFIRYRRMRGDNAVWVPGMDHAGIATQAVVERELAKEGRTRHDLGREAFVERVWAWKEESGGTILRQLRRLGASLDWEREAFTLDPPRSRAVRETFCRLYEQGLIYRGTRLINWDPTVPTALSDIEVEHEQVTGELAYLRYPAADGSEGVVVATTRPETMLGDTAVAVHPGDERYAHLVGRTLRLPLVDREIPVIADDAVDPAFGTGAVKVTPAHDPNDYEIGLRHGLPMIDVMTDLGRINANGGPYEGLEIAEARERVKADLAAQGLLVRVEPHAHSVGHSSRSGAVVEPRLSEQWFVKVGPLAERAIAAVRAGRTRFVPERNAKGFLNWLENLHDWCISRQLWWGHRIPAWYDRDGNVRVLREDPAPEEVEAEGLRQDPDVLDTWFSSQLWPFSVFGWPDRTPELDTWYPTAVLETGYDINTFWVSRMLMIGLHLLDDVPFRVVYNHGLVRDATGKKMSKSAGNVIDPLDFIDRYGADALRFALLRAAAPGQDVPLAEEWVEGARRFANKLWNAARFVLGSLGDVRPDEGLPPDAELELEDRWILSRLEAVRSAADEAYAAYDLSRAGRALYAFVWDEFCDWYLELAKLREDRAATRVLAHVLDQALRLLHPLIPFVTEELWRTLVDADDEASLSRALWPAPAPARRDDAAEAAFASLREAVAELRRFRADLRLPPSASIDVVAVADEARRPVLEAGVHGVRRLARVEAWGFADTAPARGPLGKVVLEGAALYVPLAGLVDLDAERARLRKELDKAAREVQRAERKLGNEQFVAKAAPDVVAAEREKLATWRGLLATLNAQLELLGE